MTDLKGYTRVNDLLWPAYDKECARAVFAELKQLMKAVEHCRERKVAVQAGGNCGVFPIQLAAAFEQVYTFEPDLTNFTALAVNTYHLPNVVKMQAALGDKASFVGIRHDMKDNCGDGRVYPGGNVPTIKIDDLGLQACDLLSLDVEGRELFALKGAFNTIKRFRPVIFFEDKGVSSHYGVAKGMASKYLEDTHDYRVIEKLPRDLICVPYEQAPISDVVIPLLNTRA